MGLQRRPQRILSVIWCALWRRIVVPRCTKARKFAKPVLLTGAFKAQRFPLRVKQTPGLRRVRFYATKWFREHLIWTEFVGELPRRVRVLVIPTNHDGTQGVDQTDPLCNVPSAHPQMIDRSHTSTPAGGNREVNRGERSNLATLARDRDRTLPVSYGHLPSVSNPGVVLKPANLQYVIRGWSYDYNIHTTMRG